MSSLTLLASGAVTSAAEPRAASASFDSVGEFERAWDTRSSRPRLNYEAVMIVSTSIWHKRTGALDSFPPHPFGINQIPERSISC